MIMIRNVVVCTRWKEQQAMNENLPPFVNWVRGAIRVHDIEANNLNDHDLILLCTKTRLSSM